MAKEPLSTTPLWLLTHTETHEFHHKGQIVSMARHLDILLLIQTLVNTMVHDYRKIRMNTKRACFEIQSKHALKIFYLTISISHQYQIVSA